MSQPAAPPRAWVWFGRERNVPANAQQTRSDHYRVDALVPIAGRPFDGLPPGTPLVRVEAAAPFPAGSGALVGVTQHLVYTRADERQKLVAVSARESGPVAVLIPIRKSDAWWALAQDERDGMLRPKAGPPGHIVIGLEFASRIFRRLYHARYAGGGEWDFLTYFEFPSDRADDFRALLRALRDPLSNPEWGYVERETEIWMQKL